MEDQLSNRLKLSGMIFLLKRKEFPRIVLQTLQENINLINRKKILVSLSIFHIAQDIPSKFKYIISSSLHYIWIRKPILAKLNLLLIHTPLHYIRIFYKKDKWKKNIRLE